MANVQQQAQGRGARVDLDDLIKRQRAWFREQNLPPGVNYILVVHDDNQGLTKIGANLDKAAVPMILLNEGLSGSAEVETDDDATRKTQREGQRPGAH